MKKILRLSFFIATLATAKVPRILVYSSFLDKGELGELLQKKFSVDLVRIKDFAGILGELRRLKRSGKLSDIDLVVGLNEIHYALAREEHLLDAGEAFEQSPLTLLANTTLLPEKAWPKSWADLSKNFRGKILVEDPRTSEVGLAWLINATMLGNLSMKDAKELPLRIFPKWSAAFEAFENSVAPLIWTYATSAAYYVCSARKSSYKNIPLDHVPELKNFVAPVAGKSSNADVKKIVSYMLSDEFQKEIWKRDWMIPTRNSQSPDCFKQIAIPTKGQPLNQIHSAQLTQWLDEWSL